MELPPKLEKPIGILKNVGRFVLHHLDGGHGGWGGDVVNACYPANITILEGNHDETS